MTDPGSSSACGSWIDRRSETILASSLFLGLMLVFACFYQARDWNTASRLMLTYAIVQDGTIEITSLVAKNGVLLEHPQTRDLSSAGDGRFFCDKAPGQSFLGVLPYWLTLRLDIAEPHPRAAPAMRYWPADYWVTLGTSGLCVAATAVLLLLVLRRLGVGLLWATITGLAYALATIALPYATLDYGHAATGLVTLLSVYLLRFHRCSKTAAALAGALAGFAVVLEYPHAVFPLVVLAVLALAMVFDRHSPWDNRCWLAFLAGGIPLALALGYYHWLVTGSPFRVPYTLEVEEGLFGYHKEGYGIPIGWPVPAVIFELLAGARRGLLWHSPVLLAAVPGLWRLARRGETALAAIILCTFLGLFWINAGFPTWHGGWATGPRFLLPAMPLLMLAAGYWLGTSKGRPGRCLQWLWCGAALGSMVVLLMYTTVGARIPDAVPWPLRQYVAGQCCVRVNTSSTWGPGCCRAWGQRGPAGSRGWS